MNGVIYVRYSSDNQCEESIEGQIRECKAIAKREGINIIGEYRFKDVVIPNGIPAIISEDCLTRFRPEL